MKKKVAIIGGGPAALMLAAELDETIFDVAIYEKNQAPGRKFLVAGDGGFNLTHAESIDNLIKRYTPSGFLDEAISAFSNTDLQLWLGKIGIETFTGSSNRVFPVEGIKPIQVLEKFLKIIKNKDVVIHPQHVWRGWENNSLIFEVRQRASSEKSEKKFVLADIVVFALGGASWSVTGSDGAWLELFKTRGIKTIPFEASNCTVKINWPEEFLIKAEGEPLKNTALFCGTKSRKGDPVVTKFGLEGTPVYYLSPEIRKQLNSKKEAEIYIDLKPGQMENEIYQKLEQYKGRRSIAETLKKEIRLNNISIALLHILLKKEEFTSSAVLAHKIKKLPIIITALGPIDQAISTIGGISLAEVDKTFQLKKIPNTYTIGEMLDWDAPTGGYLLQACLSMGNLLAKRLNALK